MFGVEAHVISGEIGEDTSGVYVCGVELQLRCCLLMDVRMFRWS
jgi:hypothetical protein